MNRSLIRSFARCGALGFATLMLACADRAERASDTSAESRSTDTVLHNPAVDSVVANAAEGADVIVIAADSAVAVIRAYYQAIDERRYADAYALWSDDGRSSGKSLADFTRGFDSTAGVNVEVGSPGPIGAAAGSRYITIPVTVTATSKSGAVEKFTGSYDLRRSAVDGATAAQRSWRIYSAKIRAERS
jgi:hypothetical protein